MRGQVGDEHTRALQGMIVSARIVSAFEALAHKTINGGHGSFTQSHRALPQAEGRVSDEQYAQMTPGLG
jgi:hypothetical protein